VSRLRRISPARDRASSRRRWARVPTATPVRSLLALLLGCLALLAAAPGAFAAGTDSISGTVTEINSKLPLTGVEVTVYSTETGSFAGVAITEAFGKYKVKNLAAGNYKVEFSGAAFNTRYYNQKLSLVEADPVTVTEGVDTPGINAELLELGKISGTVVSAATKLPIPGVSVSVYTFAGEPVGFAETDAKGKYEVLGLEAGEYKIEFFPTGLNYAPQYYKARPSFEAATPLPVKAEQTSVANAELLVGGVVLGRVTDAATHAPIAHILVIASPEGLEGFGGGAETDANGEYRVIGLGTGLFSLDFASTPGQVQYITQRIKGVAVTQGQATPGKDVALIRKAPVNIGSPILSGTPAVGQRLSCSNGSWTGAPPLNFTYIWRRDGSVIGGEFANTYVVQPADQGHGLTCTVTAANSVSHATAISNTLKVPAPPPPLPPLPPVPTIESVTQSNSVWSEGSKLATFSRKKKTRVGTTISFVLNEPASVSFAFTQQLGGRKVKGRCVPQTNKNRHKPSCRRTVTQGTLSFAGHTGLNKVVFQGRISPSKRLGLGAFTLQITATNPVGEPSSPRSLNFTIVR
jgi:hypothetical protein